ncbi:GATA type transcriptional activator of nitrogen-regulated proteins, partial [Coemansia sp. RSA 1694]
MTHTMPRSLSANKTTTTAGRTRSSAATSRQSSPALASLPEEGGEDSQPALTNICHNCGVDSTPLWRRDAGGNVICNACGLYFKLHGIVRPISMKRAVIKRRRRRAANNSSAAKTHVQPAVPVVAVVGRSSSLPLSASSADSSTSPHIQAPSGDSGSDYSPTYSPTHSIQPPPQPQRLPGIESLMRAAELISLPGYHVAPTDGALLAQGPRRLDRRRSYSQTSTPSP